ncbi:peroxiredoxin [Tuwongella immobilis]|uniref:thioredoxin-dependent peroxiredoxin n=1 Tax=Tuwongella immobilis TaxID=692036 RepID=A0A6C2YIM0_9BACT|nr:peroxiredoxin [Tuwongella immobilis]VIP01256.1 peroxiredoxin : Bacterioferritin comigratory protein OS=Desmospora sp. 8437 GN=bcp PE=4 SV=1: AhpC-TSA [Tuwongella immobilis]VTR97938.1 peroxiredoxin : Bacterioferritin comigratory protein OS=Desmospora sp. 8437 GN=bcp PE=4 SV=1: AhpC-TSA [Tuwongella immobilis]
MIRSLLGLLALGTLTVAATADDTALKFKEGDKLPAIELPVANAAGSKSLSLKSYEGKKNVVLYFYPKAMTKGCTIESCGFRDKAEEFAKLDTVIVGISIDPLKAQEQFVEKEKLVFPLLADSEGKVTRELGVLAKNGKVSQRVTFIVDKTGTIRKIYPTVNVQKHINEVLTYIKSDLAK